jgi:hypothetical protein
MTASLTDARHARAQSFEERRRFRSPMARASIKLRKMPSSKTMDGRVKPGHDRQLEFWIASSLCSLAQTLHVCRRQ